MRVITAPEPLEILSGETSWFLGGGITNCPDWQSEMIDLLSDTDLVLINPRRPAFDVHDARVNDAQVEWEFQGLELATGRMFWFPKESLCPITLLEFGAWSHKVDALLAVGADPEYARRWDIEKQLSLIRSGDRVVKSLLELSEVVQTRSP